MAQITVGMVQQAYAALATGDREQCRKFWDEKMRWLVPGHNQLSGWYDGLDAFLGFMRRVGQLSEGSFQMQSIAVMTADGYSADVTRNIGYRAGHIGTGQVPYTKLDIDVVHVLRWQDAKVVEGRGAIFGDGCSQYDQFWSNILETEPVS